MANWVAVRLSTIELGRVKKLNIVPARGLLGNALNDRLRSVPHVRNALSLR